MSIWEQLVSNRILLLGLLAWAVAQVVKTILHACVNGGIDWTRLVGDGGMPSAHSATVTAVAVSCGLECGFHSAVFAVAAIIAIIVMHDAMGVRRETGKQSAVLNDLVELLRGRNMEISIEEQLKVFAGHTPMQVFFGGLLGLLTAVVGHASLW